VSGTADAVQAAAGTLGSVFTEAVRSIFPSDGTSKKSKNGKKGKKGKNVKASAGGAKVRRAKKRDQAQVTH
jgi:hypothetical protein